ncbi:MAG: peptidylprolyl isomerase [Verrucomicrobia bacterium]|nr:peptidylprolyl isomerase [Verrucomicrobiota bacterium]
MKRSLRWMALAGATTLAALNMNAAEESKKDFTAKAGFTDEIVAKGKGCEVKRSQVDEAFILHKANAAAQGETIAEADREMVESRLLDRLIYTQLLIAKSTEAEKVKGKETAEKIIAEYKSQAPSEEAFNRRLTALGLTPEKFRAQMIEQGVCEQVVDRELKSKVKVTAEDTKKFYEENAARFEQPEQVRAAHVLISTKDPTGSQDLSDEQKKEKKKLAEKVLARAKAGEDFAKLAKEFSEDPGSKDKGGEYTFPRGQMVPEFEAAAFSLKTNQVSDIVTTQFGYHIIKTYENLPAQKVEFAKVEPEIKERLQLTEVQKQLPDFLEKLKTDAGIELVAARAKKADAKK